MRVVLNFIRSLGNNESLSFKELTLKTVTLMVLSRPMRSADLAALEVDAMQKLADGMNFVPRHLSKQSRQGRVIAGFFSPCI